MCFLNPKQTVSPGPERLGRMTWAYLRQSHPGKGGTQGSHFTDGFHTLSQVSKVKMEPKLSLILETQKLDC